MGDIVKLGRKEFGPRTATKHSALDVLGIREGDADGKPTDVPGGNANLEVKGGAYVDSATQRPWGARYR